MRAPRPTYAYLVAAARKVGELGEAARQGKDAVVERRRAGLLVEPEAREGVVDLLNAQFARGVLDAEEREHRVGTALEARTRGELARAVHGLDLSPTPLPPPARRPSRVREAAGNAAEQARRTLRAAALLVVVLIGLVVAVVVLAVVLNNT